MPNPPPPRWTIRATPDPGDADAYTELATANIRPLPDEDVPDHIETEVLHRPSPTAATEVIAIPESRFATEALDTAWTSWERASSDVETAALPAPPAPTPSARSTPSRSSSGAHRTVQSHRSSPPPDDVVRALVQQTRVALVVAILGLVVAVGLLAWGIIGA